MQKPARKKGDTCISILMNSVNDKLLVQHDGAMRQICFLSMDDLGSYVADDDLAVAPLAELGCEAATLSWRQTNRSWSDFEMVVIRTPWDYQSSPNDFLTVLAEIK
ncbi:MAG: hypothetical protein ACRD6X_06080, partial [Pyrinomonadaceae bacterium]